MATTLVTGGAGFIGSHIVDLLVRRGDRVLVLDDLSAGATDHLPETGVELVAADVRDEQRLAPLVRQSDRVMHLAAAVGVKRLARTPLDVMERNVEGTASVLRACARWRRPLLLASSSEVYGHARVLPMREDQALTLGPSRSGSRWPYAVSKLACEHYALAHGQRHGLPVVIVRLFNTAGPRQSPDHGMVIPRFVNQALGGEPITVYGDGSQRRCFCHVHDVAEAMVALAGAPGASGLVVNIGSEETVSILDLARRIKALTGSRSPVRRIPFEQAYGPDFEDMDERRPDLGRARALLGFAPRRNLECILTDVIQHTSTRLERCRA